MAFDFFGQADSKPTNKREAIDPLLKKAIMDELFKKQGGRCMYDGRKVQRDLFELDHKVPVSRGGTNRKSNFQLLCGTCNKRKGDLTDREFRRKYRAAGVPQTQVLPERTIPQKRFEEAGKVAKAAPTNRPATRRKQIYHDWDWSGNARCGTKGGEIADGLLQGVTCRKCLNM